MIQNILYDTRWIYYNKLSPTDLQLRRRGCQKDFQERLRVNCLRDYFCLITLLCSISGSEITLQSALVLENITPGFDTCSHNKART